MITYPCPLDDRVPVLEIPFGPDSRTHAFCVHTDQEEAVIVIDSTIREKSWFTSHHLSAIFAHELGHCYVGDEEEDAERWAIERLQELGLTQAAQLLLDRGIV